MMVLADTQLPIPEIHSHTVIASQPRVDHTPIAHHIRVTLTTCHITQHGKVRAPSYLGVRPLLL